MADRIGATIDTTASEGHAPSILAMQEVGESTCTLGEVRNRCDLVIYWGSDPVTTHPRHMERYSTDACGLHIPNGRADRTLVVIDSKPTSTSALADEFVQIDETHNFEALWTLRTLLRGLEPPETTTRGLPMPELRRLARQMSTCRSGILFFGYGVARQPLGHRSVEALLRLVTDLNAFTRFYARRMRVVGDVSGADSVLCWQTGFPFSVNLSRGFPRYNPGEYSAADVLARREADAVLFVGASRTDQFPAEAVAHLETIPTILLDHPQATSFFEPTIRIATSVYGIHHAGTAYRMDEVPIPLRSILQTDLPNDGSVLRQIMQELKISH
jgi:formylmethanofuran dehydrogenase subunit B